MKAELISKFKTLSRRKKIGVSVASALTAALVVTVPVAAWFTTQRKLADLQYVNSPSKLYIRAGHDEELEYIDLSNVQVTATTDTAKYYVFAVTGSNTSYYNLQLSYTTNNQFEYFLYPAEENEGNAPANTAMPYVPYTAHGDAGTAGSYYYTVQGSVITYQPNGIPTEDAHKILNGTKITRQGVEGEITAGFLNQDGSLIKATKDTVGSVNYHDNTYNYDVNKVQDCAEPLYWQARGIKSGMDSTTRELKDYYILEVNWAKAKAAVEAEGGVFTDNRETDVIYISVASGTGN
ncbi:hypothetical protein [Ruminococcus flavefaciens]|uniref:hypothetical protein n=1 Tax=Ruminococcus flavefaciens TaxID=1265 RepID=UPI0013DB2312|nr:hypothetical protein [Ruminococcus flavefaciens]